MSGIRRIARPPLYARISERAFLRWAARATQSRRLASIGERSVIFPPALMIGHERIRIGSGVIVHPGAFFSVVGEVEGRLYDGHLAIGDGTRIGFDMVIACCGEITIGRRVLTADRVYIGDTYHGYRDTDKPVIDQGLGDPRPVRIGDGAFLGVNSAILPGATVGGGAYVAANAVVTGDVPPHSLVVGNPARVVRRWTGSEWIDVPGSA